MEHSSKPLAILAANNDIVLVADPDHTDDNISKTVQKQLADMKAQGTKHLFLEHDPYEVTIEEIAGQNTWYGEVARTALELGMEIHFYDDRTQSRELDAKYPKQQTLPASTFARGFPPDSYLCRMLPLAFGMLPGTASSR
jgi:hypothetical protein